MTRGLREFDEHAGLLLDALLRVYRAWGRHRTACDLSTALATARAEGRAELAASVLRVFENLPINWQDEVAPDACYAIRIGITDTNEALAVAAVTIRGKCEEARNAIEREDPHG